MASNTHSLDLERNSSQYAWVNDPTGLDITGDMTIEFWVKTETLDANTYFLTHNGDAASELEADNMLFGVWSDAAGKIHVGHESGLGTNNFVVTTSAYVTNATYVHVAVVRDSVNKNYLIYTDGVYRETLAYTNNATGGSNADFQIGVIIDTSGGNVYYDGLIDEVRIWNDIRTANEIAYYWKRDVSGQTGLLGQWKLNNSYADTTGTNNLTAVGSPVFSTDVPFATYVEEGGAFLFNMI